MLRHRWPVIVLGLTAAAGSIADHFGVFGALGPDRQRYDRAVATVTHVVDGDTCDIDIPDSGRNSTRVRLLGVDCPEVSHGDGETDAYFGRDAAKWTESEVAGKRVKIVLDPTRPVRDKHGRLLVYLFVADDGVASETASLNQQLIDRGLAFADWRFEHVHELRFERAERLAVRAKTGMWKGMTRERMPQWRQEMMNESRDSRR